MANKHMKRCPTLLAIRRMQTKTAMRHRYKPVRVAQIKRLTISSVDEDVEELQL